MTLLRNVLAVLAYWFPEQFVPSLQYMWQGMLCIFVVIGVIIGSICLMNVIHEKASRYKVLFEKDEQEK